METTADRLPPPHPPPHFKSTPFTTTVDSELDLYTIPSHSCWFSWDSIHETERAELREFFDGSSFTRTAKIYKDYRDFIISKYREDCSRRLTFTEVRKSLVGDVCVLRKVFNFLDKWGLINFGAPPLVVEKEDEGLKIQVEEGAPVGIRVVAIPNSSKPLIVPPPISGGGDGDGDVGGGVDSGFKLPPLASYSDVFGLLGKKKRVVCENCKEKCDSKYYECTKEKYLICFNCFEKGIYGENKSADDFKLNDSLVSSSNQGNVWTEAEILLLLESVLKYGDDWELVAQNVQTKSKLECISRLIELPFGELMLGPHNKCSSRGVVDDTDTVQEQKASNEMQEPSNEMQEPSEDPQEPSKEVQEPYKEPQEPSKEPHEPLIEPQEPAKEPQEPLIEPQEPSIEPQEPSEEPQEPSIEPQKPLIEPQEPSIEPQEPSKEPQGPSNKPRQPSIEPHDPSNEPQETSKMEDNDHQEIVEKENSEKLGSLEPPLKKKRVDSSDPSRSLMEQVALISTMVDSQITATAASAAVSVLSDGNPLVKDIFYSEANTSLEDRRLGNLDIEIEKTSHSEDSEMVDATHSSEVDKVSSARDSIPLALRMRAAVATALGAAAVRARLLADHEEREIEHLMAFIIETQLKKLQRKAKFLDDLEQLMEEEHSALDKLKDSIVTERIDTLQKIFEAGATRLKGYPSSLKLAAGSL